MGNPNTNGFQFGKEGFFILAGRSRGGAEAYWEYAVPASPQIGTARVEKNRFQR